MENELELRVSQALVENQHLIDLLVKKNEVLEETIAEQALELEDDNRRIEACYNIIKTCKGIAVDLQRGQNG